jgi:NodT family efflux transporter outer membrane factor (OMF) lipoprotein
LKENLRLLRRVLVVLISICLVGCAVGPDFEEPLAPLTSSYTEVQLPGQTVSSTGHGGAAQNFVMGQDIPGHWWTLFHSKHLNDLIEKGIEQNNTLQAAQATLRQADANYRASFGSLFPAVAVGGSATKLKANGSSANQNTPAQTYNLFTQGLNISYTLDVFGGIRRQIEAAGAQVDFSDFEEKAAYLTLTSNIVTTAVNEASLRAQIMATEELIKLLQNNLEISRKRFDLGALSKLDVLAQETQLLQTQGTLPPLQLALTQTRSLLSVLIGELPSESRLGAFSLDEVTLPTELPLTIPSSLVNQRPDVKAAAALLHEASAQIGVATANLLPQLTIVGRYGGSSNFIKDLFKSSNNVWSLLGNVAQPIFDGGKLFSEREAAVAAFEAAFANYRQTVLEAYKNVADVLRALELDAEQLKLQTEAEKAALDTMKMTQAQYDLGAISYLNLIIAQRQYQLARISRIRAEAARYTDTAALFQALGGGWWNRHATPDPTSEAAELDKGEE